MNTDPVKVKRVLISVSDKTGLTDFATLLRQLNIEIISTGGTAKTLIEAGIPVQTVSEITTFPEIMEGRVKTLHPKIEGGILGKRDRHYEEAKQHDIPWIDLVICNLYPFSETIKNPDVCLDEAIENIDVGGPTMIRAAAKNLEWVGVIVSPLDYKRVEEALQQNVTLDFDLRKELSTKAFSYTAQYDAIIAAYFNEQAFPQQLNLTFEKLTSLRYGENPHQDAAIYQNIICSHDHNIITAKQHQGKELSYNNIVDAESAVACVKEFDQPACVIIKHANPCGVAEHPNLLQAYLHAWQADSLSAFGSVIALNKKCTQAIAEELIKVFVEIIIAPEYDDEALTLLQQKKNLRVLELDLSEEEGKYYQFKSIGGGLLLQTRDSKIITKKDIQVVTEKTPINTEVENLLFAWHTVKHCKSNAIVIAKDKRSVGIGPGQVSRIDSVEIALNKAHNQNALKNSVLASDAFFPFRDSIDRIAHSGILAIIQPGGSIRDKEIIAACDEYGLVMVFTGYRSFYH